MPKVCEWKTIEIGNWYTEYQCAVCDAKYIEQPEDLRRQEDWPCKLEAVKDD